MTHTNTIATSALDEVKLAEAKTFLGASARGALIGAGLGAGYGAVRGVVRERARRPGRRSYGRAALEGAMDHAPRSGLIGAGLGFAHHGWKVTDRSIQSARSELKDQSEAWKSTAHRVGRTADETARAIQQTSGDVRALRDATDRVLLPVGDAIHAAKAEGLKRQAKPGFFARLARRKAGDFLAKGK